jgi:hypothetical protein
MIAVPVPPARQKVCVVCGKDVSQADRIKDPQGNYYCQPCWQASLDAYQALPSDIRDEQAMVARSTFFEASRRKTAPRKSELVRLITTFFNMTIPRRAKRVIAAVIVVFLGLGWFVPRAAVTLGATMIVLGIALLVFWAVWQLGLPFRDGIGTGMACLMSARLRHEWAENNRDYRLRRPGRLLRTSIGMILLSLLCFGVAGMAWRRGGIDSVEKSRLPASRQMPAATIPGAEREAPPTTLPTTREPAPPATRVSAE